MPSKNINVHLMWLHKFFNEKATEQDLKVSREFLDSDKELGLYQEATDGRIIAIIVKDEKFLLLDHKKIGKWTFPIGKIDEGEYPYLALQRESFEELGIMVREATDLKIKGIKPPINPSAHFHVYKINRYDNEIYNKEPEKHTSLKWVTPDQLIKMISHNEVDIITANCLNKMK